MAVDYDGIPIDLLPGLPRDAKELRRRVQRCIDRQSSAYVDDALTFAALLARLTDEELVGLLGRKTPE